MNKFIFLLLLPIILLPSVFAYDLPPQFDEPCPTGQSVVQASCFGVNNNHDGVHINIDDIASNATAIDVLQGNVTSLSDRINDNDIDIGLLEGSATVLEGNITSLDGRVTQNETDITSIFSILVTILSNIVNLGIEDVNLQTQITLNDNDITDLQSQDIIHTDRTDSLNATQITQQSEIDILESDVIVLQDNVINLGSKTSDNANDIAIINSVLLQPTTFSTDIFALQDQDIIHTAEINALEAQPVRTILLTLSNGGGGSVTTFGSFFSQGTTTTTIDGALRFAPLAGMDGHITNFVFTVGLNTVQDWDVVGTVFINDQATTINCSIPSFATECSTIANITVSQFDQILVKTDMVYVGSSSSSLSFINVFHKLASVTIESP